MDSDLDEEALNQEPQKGQLNLSHLTSDFNSCGLVYIIVLSVILLLSYNTTVIW